MARLRIVNVTNRLRSGRRRRVRRRNNRINVVTNPPIVNPRPRVNFDGQYLNGSQIFIRELTAANVASHIFLADCSNVFSTGGSGVVEGIARQLSGVTGLYQEFRFIKIQMSWIPHVSPGSSDGGSPMYIGWIDNPEIMVTACLASPLSVLAGVKALRTMKTFNSWQPFVYNVPLSRRLPWFNVNTNEVINDSNIFERSTQGAVVTGAESISAVADLGSWRVTYTVQLKGLTNFFST